MQESPSLRQAWQMGMFAIAAEEISQGHKTASFWYMALMFPELSYAGVSASLCTPFKMLQENENWIHGAQYTNIFCQSTIVIKLQSTMYFIP